MCIEYHNSACPACGKVYLVYVEFCRDYHPPLLYCPGGIVIAYLAMGDGHCPSRICPNGADGGCALM